ncbi:heavy metal sensor histidine kinase [Massilia sp. CF038]|uniref:heavy metal sensor histidine kinase n=1 Tax=Massilia sp. CF038 TaxID=1881045 RepID=UPI0009151131|nr:heavy metal sensor histidine kinase [Massilia sp. CF038]SHH20460.1 two-component system, OmpR family, heavy metal sensor histidine kinase CusS [Massilia sp. CF038]
MKLWPGSISMRLAWLFALASVLVSGAIGTYLYQSLEREIASRDDTALIGRVDRMRALVDDSASVEALRSKPNLYGNMLGNRDSVLWMIDAQGKRIIEINPDQLPLPSLRASKRIDLADAAEGKPTRLAWVDVEQGGRHFQLVAGKMLAERNLILASYRNTLLIALAVGAILSFALGWLIGERSLRPVRQLADRAAAIDVRSLHVRLDGADTQPRELRALSAALNQMLQRLAGGFAQLSRFSEDLAHEMRTPLGNLMGHTQQTLGKARSIQEYEDLLASNQEEYERLARMIDSMLFLARSEHTDAVIEREAIDLAELAGQLVDYFEGMAEERGVAFAVHASGILHADRVLVRRAMANLMANALQHGPQNSTVTVSAEAQAESVAIMVHNTGVAIDEKHLPHLFERFYRCDSARTKGTDSGGLGLAIVRSIMDLHGGSAGVVSGQGGTCFTLRFPRRVIP